VTVDFPVSLSIRRFLWSCHSALSIQRSVRTAELRGRRTARAVAARGPAPEFQAAILALEIAISASRIV
jgi:hypothetical protein